MEISDPFTSTANCVDRLYKEWCKHGKILISVDFDDTVYDFHSAGNDHLRVINILEECQKLGFYITVFTASKPDRFDFIREFMSNIGIQIHSINENPIPLHYGNNGKVYYNILLDDKAGLGQALDILETTVKIIQKNLQLSLTTP